MEENVYLDKLERRDIKPTWFITTIIILIISRSI